MTGNGATAPLDWTPSPEERRLPQLTEEQVRTVVRLLNLRLRDHGNEADTGAASGPVTP